MGNKEKFFMILNQEMIYATGCTEPAAISYAASVAANEIKKLGDDIKEIKVIASKNMIKNALAAGLPNSDKIGIRYAAGIGAIHGDPLKKLDVNCDVDKEAYDKATKLIKKNKISVEVAKVPNVLYIEVIVNGDKHTARSIIKDAHTNVTLIEIDGKIKYQKEEESNDSGKYSPEEIADFLSLEKIWDFATKELDPINDPIDILRKAVEVNSTIADEGLKNDYGLKVGKNLMSAGNVEENYVLHAITRTTAASDARMAGAPFSVVTNSGSGNQGITNVMPLVTLADDLKVGQEKKYRALALGNLTSIYIKSQFGTLSAFCGAAVASTGAAAGITYLRGGDFKAYERTIENMIGTVTGMLCDGAKPDCSLKIYVGLQGAFNASDLALKGIRVEKTEGIVCETAEESIKNMCALSKKCSDSLDSVIVDMLLEKH